MDEILNAKEVQKIFLKRIKAADREKCDRALLTIVFEDLDRVLEFKSMDSRQLHLFLGQVRDIQFQIQLPSVKSRKIYFGAVENAAKALARLNKPFPWGGFSQEFLKDVKALEAQLNEMAAAKKTWGRGRPLEFSRPQELALRGIYSFLSQSQMKQASRWRGLKIKELGQFLSQNRSMDQTYRATPERLISNLAKAVGVTWTETSVHSALKNKQRHDARRRK